jgi:hypothetical protein
MVLKSTKRILALVVAGVMVVGSSLTAFAAEDDGTVDGTGAVEYDNSEALEYDKVMVPVIKDLTSYNFTLDPNGLLHTYMPSTYDDSLIYFTAEDTPETIEPAESITLYEKVKDEVADTDGAYADVAKALSEKKDSITEIEDGPFYVWAPDTTTSVEDGNYTKGYMGKYIELSAENINLYFDVDDAEGLTIKPKQDHLAMPDVFDGKLYTDSYVAIDGNKIEISAQTKLADYGITVEDGEITEATGLFKSDTGTAVDVEADLVYTAATTKAKNSTDKVYVVNKSTKAKTVKAVVTMTNASGITFNPTSTFEDDDENASMYLAATNGSGTGSTTAALEASEDGATAKATYTLDLAAPTATDITYMDSTLSDVTGGHNYFRFAPQTVNYNDDAFYLTAMINANGADAWEEWAGKVTETTRPKLNIVYSVTDKVDKYVSSTTISASSNTVSVTMPSDVTISSVVLTKATGGNVTLTAGTHYTISGSDYTFDASMLGNHKTGSVTFTFSDEKTETLNIE